MINEFNISQNIAVRDEVMFIQYDTLLQFSELNAFKYLMRNYDVFNKHLKLDLFRNYGTDECIAKALIDRNEWDMVRWLARDKSTVTDEMYRNIMKIVNSDTSRTLTDFAAGIDTLMVQNCVSKIYVYTDYVNGQKADIIIDIFREHASKFTLLTKANDDETMRDIIRSKCPDATTFFIDDVDFIKEMIDKEECKNKTFILPFTGYNFDIEDGIMMCKHELEFLAYDNNCNLGFIHLFKFNEGECALG